MHGVKFRYFCRVYELRALYAYYLGLFLLTALVVLVVFKHTNPSRYRSMVFFWMRTSSSEEFNKPYTLSRAFSWLGFLFRALVFGSIVQIYLTKSLTPMVFNDKMLLWTLGFMLYWGAKTLVEGGLAAILGFRDGLLKIFYIRSIFKEKLAFLYCCLMVLLLYITPTSLVANILAISYFVALLITHLRFLKLYFRNNPLKKVLIITYICAFEIVPVWLLTQTLKL